ncbi:hypothetical protein [Saccharospirillum salsuginis]|uniref:Uncharacterized protein n=1 Tax=Saccharospirillum salsuginis TaxID=418750 RepID=A0A918K8K3_9GAMM|nr:hypothetical protein [Saccharospirillum salsuginis]GGX54668.1 hypothetical protein GCM10007392_22630 [Saccharospirillum salsuginis]
MKPGFGQALASALITMALSALTASDPELPAAIGYTLFGLASMNLLGALLMLTPMNKAGAILVIVFSIPFVPIGIIGILGGRKWLDELKREAFNAAVG